MAGLEYRGLAAIYGSLAVTAPSFAAGRQFDRRADTFRPRQRRPHAGANRPHARLGKSTTGRASQRRNPRLASIENGRPRATVSPRFELKGAPLAAQRCRAACRAHSRRHHVSAITVRPIRTLRQRLRVAWVVERETHVLPSLDRRRTACRSAGPLASIGACYDSRRPA
jgi:hypothetical protein